MNGIRLVILVILAGVLTLGCAAPSTTTTTPSTPPATATSTTPAITTTTPTPPATTPTSTPATPAALGLTILTPGPNAYLVGADVTVTVAVTGFRLLAGTGQGNAPGEGHLIYYLDAEPPVTAGEPAFTAPGSYAVSADTSHLWSGVITNGHTFWVQMVNNDDTPLDPPVTAKVVVTVYTD